MKYIFLPFFFLLYLIVWPIARIMCLFGKHSGLEIKHWGGPRGELTKHEIHCSACNKIEVKV